MKTLLECIEITNSNPKFIKVEQLIHGYNVISFNYIDGTTIPEFEDADAFELRGLTFVDGKPFPMLEKFWNLGEKSVQDIEDSLDKEVKSVQTKDDGSLIGFLVLPNGLVIPKTKMGFSNEFTEIATQWLYENDNRETIKQLYEEGIYPLFECVSNKHKIVLEYNWEGLKLIQARTSNWGYLEVLELEKLADDNNWIFEKPLSLSIKELLKLKSEITEVEGFVVRFHDDTFVKIKTDWYFEKHASNEGIRRANELLVGYFSGEDRTEENFDKEFIKHASINVLSPFSITSLDELKLFIFKTGTKQQQQTYQQIFKKFLKEYSLFYDYTKENTLINLTINNSIDDILPSLTNSERDFALTVQRNVNKYIKDTLLDVSSILGKESNHLDVKQTYKTHHQLGLILRNLNKEISLDLLEKNLKDNILKNTRNLRNAQKFLLDIQNI